MPDFNIKKDIELIANGTHFWCEACVVARPLDDRSPDLRYCQSCFEVLAQEASLLNPRSRPKWAPKDTGKAKIGTQKVNKVVGDAVLIMHTINGDKIPSVHNSVRDPIKPPTRRGPRFRADLPVDLIQRWASEGMGSKAITTQLKKELGIIVHYSTIQRIISGQRVMV